MSTSLAHMGAGFADPVHGAQQTFRVLLAAMSEPGSLHVLHAAAVDGLAPTDTALRPPLGVAMAATLLTLLDADTPAHLAGALDGEPSRAWLRFHTGARTTPDVAAITAALACDVDVALREALDLGTDEAPQGGATLIVEVDALSDQPLADGIALTLRGPGIESVRNVAVAGLPAAFWHWRAVLQSELPRGVDLILVCGAQVAAIPRSTRIDVEG